MVWFNMKELEHKIACNSLSDKDGFNYLLAFVVVFAIAVILGGKIENSWFKFSACLFHAFISVWGLNASFTANMGIDGRDFFKRFFAISWIIALRLFFAAIILIFLLLLIVGAISNEADVDLQELSPLKDLVIVVFGLLFTVIYYLLVIGKFYELAPLRD